MCEGSNLSAIIEFDKVPVIPSLKYYLDKQCFPGGTQRNLDSYGDKIGPVIDEQKYILADPQTSGGLLVAVAETGVTAFEEEMFKAGFEFKPIGWLNAGTGKPLITVI